MPVTYDNLLVSNPEMEIHTILGHGVGVAIKPVKGVWHLGFVRLETNDDGNSSPSLE